MTRGMTRSPTKAIDGQRTIAIVHQLLYKNTVNALADG